MMLRSMISLLLLAAVIANGAVLAADLPPMHRKARIMVKAPPPPVAVVVHDDLLISPMLPSTPLLLGRQELPGYYGRAFSYDYQGPYYGGDDLPSFRWRLPYACGVYGYC